MLALLRVAPGGCGFFPAFGAFRRTWANARWGAALDIAIRRERISLAAPPSRTWDAMAVETTAPRNRAVPETRIVDQFGRAAVGSVQAPLDSWRSPVVEMLTDSTFREAWPTRMSCRVGPSGWWEPSRWRPHEGPRGPQGRVSHLGRSS